MDRRDGARQPAGHGQRDALPLRQPEVRGAPRPALLPEPRRPARAAGHRGRGAQPVACRVRDRGGGRGRRARGRHPGRRRRGGRSGRRRDAGRGRPDRPRARPGPARAELHGRHRPRRQQRHLHRRRVALAAARGRCRDRPVRLGVRRLRPFRGSDRLLADHQLRLRGRARRVRLPGVLPGRPRDELGHPLRRGLQAPGTVPRPGRPRPRARQADHGGQGRPERPGAGGRDGPHRLARRRGAGDRCGPRRGRGHPVPRSRRAPRDGRARRGRPADGPARRSRPDGGRDRVDGRGVAHRRPRAADRPGPPARARLRASRHPRGAADDGLHRQPARSVGRGRPRHRVRRRVRGDGRVGRLRRAGPGPRLPVPLAGVRGRHGQRGDRRAPGGHGRAPRHPAGLRVADVRRAAARDQGAPRRGRPRGTAPARRRPGLPGDRRGRPLGATPRASPGRRAMAARVAGAGGEPDLVRSRSAPDAAARPTAGGAVRAREPGPGVGRRRSRSPTSRS